MLPLMLLPTAKIASDKSIVFKIEKKNRREREEGAGVGKNTKKITAREGSYQGVNISNCLSWDLELGTRERQARLVATAPSFPDDFPCATLSYKSSAGRGG